jgi:hypothetical protein
MEDMSFPELSRSTAPLREADADALLLALPPVDRDGQRLLRLRLEIEFLVHRGGD